MIDLNVGALTDLCRAVAPAMIKRKSGAILNVASTAAFQPGPEHGGLFRDQGVRPVAERGAARGVEAARRPASPACARARPGPSSAKSPASAAMACSTASRWTRRRWSKAGLDGLDKNQAVVVPGLRQQARRERARASRRVRSFAKSPGRSNIERKLNPCGAPPLASRHESGAGEQNGRDGHDRSREDRARCRSRACRRPTAAAASRDFPTR